MKTIKIVTLFLAVVPALSACSYTAQATKTRPAYQTSADCKTQWEHVSGIEKYWFPGSVEPPNYIMYKNHLIQAWETIGDVYYHGCPEAGIAENKQKAFFWYQSAALEHVDTSQYKIGMMLINGDDVPTDRKRGMEWLTSAAIEGSTEARSYLASVGMQAPPVISPNSYETYQELARQKLIEGEQRDRAAVMRDLGNLAVNTVKLVSQAVIDYSLPQGANYTHKPAVRYVERTEPVFCSVYANSSQVFNTVYVNAQVFCH